FAESKLTDADLREANLCGADLRTSQLVRANLRGAKVEDVDFEGALCVDTIFDDLDLSRAKSLGAILHLGPSSVGVDTLFRSKGQIPEVFLGGCGVPDPVIVTLSALVGALEPIQYYSVFISYSPKDQPVADRLYADLQARGIRCFFDREDLKIGD